MAKESAVVQTVRNFAVALQQCTAASASQDLLTVFLARDRVQHCIQQNEPIPESTLGWLVELDQELESLAGESATRPELLRWRKSLQPPEKNWWWYTSPPAKGIWYQLDWLWNAASIVCLAAFASYLTALTAKFAVGGFDLLKSFGLIGNGTVAVLILTSLTQSGRKVLIKLLERLKVPAKYHSEVSFAASAVLLVSAITLQSNLHHIGQYYYTQGSQNFADRRFITAEKQLRQALELQPNNGDAHVLLGRIYEIQENIDAARLEYNLSLQHNNAVAYNNLGKLLIGDGSYTEAEALLTKGINVAKTFDQDNAETLFALHKNLGWAQLELKKPSLALINLQEASRLNEEELDNVRIGEADCILSAIFENLNLTTQAVEAANTCVGSAAFETALDHKWFIASQARLHRLQAISPATAQMAPSPVEASTPSGSSAPQPSAPSRVPRPASPRGAGSR